MKKTIKPPMLDSEKQVKPMVGETSPEEAKLKGAMFAAQERARIEAAKKLRK